MKFTAYITVRLNSKRLPMKSVKKIGNLSLVERTIKMLNNTKSVDDIILYSVKDVEDYIENKSLNYRFFKRPENTLGDFASFNDVLDSIIDKIETDYIVFVSCTSPFINSKTIEDMILKVKNYGHDSSFAATENKGFCWFKGSSLNYDVNKDIPRTQDLEPVLIESSSVYIFSKKDYNKNKRRIGKNPFIKNVSLIEGWDIDTKEDFLIAQGIYGAGLIREDYL